VDVIAVFKKKVLREGEAETLARKYAATADEARLERFRGTWFLRRVLKLVDR